MIQYILLVGCLVGWLVGWVCCVSSRLGILHCILQVACVVIFIFLGVRADFFEHSKMRRG